MKLKLNGNTNLKLWRKLKINMAKSHFLSSTSTLTAMMNYSSLWIYRMISYQTILPILLQRNSNYLKLSLDTLRWSESLILIRSIDLSKTILREEPKFSMFKNLSRWLKRIATRFCLRESNDKTNLHIVLMMMMIFWEKSWRKNAWNGRPLRRS